MGVVLNITKWVFIVLVVYLIGFLPGYTGPKQVFKKYEVTPAVDLSTSSITWLNDAEKFKEDILVGTESVPVKNGRIYTGHVSGKIVSTDGDKVSYVMECGKSKDTPCGYPVGMRFDKAGKLIVADGVRGIYKVDVDSGAVTLLVDAKQKIEGYPCSFSNDLDVASDGTVYWSDVSYNASMGSAWKIALDEPSGRLLKYDPKTKKASVVLDNIYGANGITLSPDEDFVLVNELVRSRTLRYYLKGPKKGQHDVFADGLPGLPDNIRPNNRGGVRVFLFSSRSGTEFILSHPHLRKVVYRFCELLDNLKHTIPSIFPEFMANVLEPLIPVPTVLMAKTSSVIAVDLDWSGKLVGSFQNSDGTVTFVSEFTELGDYIYAASPIQNHMMRAKVSKTKNA